MILAVLNGQKFVRLLVRTREALGTGEGVFVSLLFEVWTLVGGGWRRESGV